MRRVVVTGVGIVSPIGNNTAEVTESLKEAKSGINFDQSHKEMGFRSHVSGQIKINLQDLIDRKFLRFMGDGASYNYLAMLEALKDSGLEENEISNPMTGLIMGSGGPSTKNLLRAFDITRDTGPKKIGPTSVPKVMCSTNSATLSTFFKIRGMNYSITSACSTSAHCIGHAADLIRSGQQDIVIAGGSDDEHWSSSCLFDAMGALSSNFNSDPVLASRPYDSNRDGFVISGGSGMIILEEEEHAKKRGAKILAKLSGYFANSDGYDMVAPSGEGAIRCMEGAIKNSGVQIDYINTHGTSTPVGDVAELKAIKKLFNSDSPMISSTKSMTGHSLGATGAHEAIYSIMMLNENFIAPSINIESLCDEAKGLNIITETKDVNIDNVLSNSFGFGGTNASLIVGKVS